MTDVSERLGRIELQLGQIISDTKREGQSVKDFEHRLRSVEDWKNNMMGRVVVTLSITGIILSAIITLLLMVISKRI